MITSFLPLAASMCLAMPSGFPPAGPAPLVVAQPVVQPNMVLQDPKNDAETLVVELMRENEKLRAMRDNLKSEMTDRNKQLAEMREQVQTLKGRVAEERKNVVDLKKETESLRATLKHFANVEGQMEKDLVTQIFTPKHAGVYDLINAAESAYGLQVTYFQQAGPSPVFHEGRRARFTGIQSSNQVIVTDFPDSLARAIDFLDKIDQAIGVQKQRQRSPSASNESEDPQLLLRTWLVGPKEVYGDELLTLPTEMTAGLSALVPGYQFGGLAHSMTRTPAKGEIRTQTCPPHLGVGDTPIASWTNEFFLESYDPQTKQLTMQRFMTTMMYAGGGGLTDNLSTSLTLTEGEYAVVGSVRGGQSYVVISFTKL